MTMATERIKQSMDALTDAHARMHAAELATKTVYCLCGQEFPTGKVKRIAYGTVQYADDRCTICVLGATKEGN
jgi:hypothetical protein